jgi:trehalose/maltose transport system substrate-binding protein
MKNLAPWTLLACVLSLMLPVGAFGQQAAEGQSNFEANVQKQDHRTDGGISILEETCRRDDTPDHICLVLWVPTEFWRRSLERDPRNTPEKIEDGVQMFDRYTLFLVIDAKKDGRAVLDYIPSELIHSTTAMVSPRGETFTPLNEDALVWRARILLPMLKPLLSKQFGSLGQHMEFLFFPGKDKSGAKIVDPLGTGTLTINVNSHSFAWHLPLGSLLPQKSCPICGQTFPGNYEFCPYDGTKLVERPSYKPTTSVVKDTPRLQPPPQANPNTMAAERVVVRLAADNSSGAGGRWIKARVLEWAQKTGNTLEYIDRPNDSTATIYEFWNHWRAQSADIDVYMIDAAWLGIAAPHSTDLKKYFSENEIGEHFPRIIQNNTVDNQLVGMPFLADAGLLYYRTDLLEKYNFNEPPKTWGELARMAKKIQDGERQGGKRDFQGFVFEGKASESLTCNAIEWIYSFGGGTVVDSEGKVTINNPNAIKALDTARSWVGTISPESVTTYGEEEARRIWQSGNASFMRNWPYAYVLSEAPNSSISGKVAFTVLPKGGDNGKNAACLGGWQLMVSKYSKHPRIAADLVRYLCSAEVQKRRALELWQLPTRPELYADQQILANTPWFANMRTVLDDAVARPSTVLKAKYFEVSTAVFQNVNKVLSRGESATDAIGQIEQTTP